MKLGIDAVEIERFEAWHTFTGQKLARLFSTEEIDYCLANPARAAERFAVRFVAREAFYKALSQAGHNHISFFKLCRQVSVTRNAQGIPFLRVNWNALGLNNPLQTSLSLTHTKTTAVAVVLIKHEGNYYP